MAIPNYRSAISTILSITGCVRQFTKDPYVNQVCSGLENSMTEGDADAVFFELERLKSWYDSNLSSIRSNPAVYNWNAHVLAYSQIPDAYNTLKAHPEWFVEHRDSTSAAGALASKQRMVFVSHSSSDIEYVNAFVDLIRTLGLDHTNLFCSSYPGFGIPTGEDIMGFLKHCFSDYELCVIFVLSKDNYYSSAPCLNEMGASWVLGTKSYAVLLPGMEFSMMAGAITSDCIAVRLESDDAAYRLNEVKDGIVEFLGLNQPRQSVWEHDRNLFLEETKRVARGVAW